MKSETQLNYGKNFVALLLTLSCLLIYTSAEEKIVNGRPENITDSPNGQSLNSGSYYCAGSLISMRLVITAAHCIKGFEANNTDVLAGTTDLRQVGQRRRVDRMWFSNNYDSATMDNDIGAILVRRPFNPGRTVSTIGLCNARLTARTQMRVSGWGRTGENEPSVNELRTATVSIVARRTCINQYENANVVITNAMFCAGRGVRDSCRGDSGAPGVVNGQMCGVVSFAIGCARKEYPGVYTNVNNPDIRLFISNVLNQ